MNEKMKLLWLMAAIDNTLNSRLRVSLELSTAFYHFMNLASAELDPENTVPPPNIMYFVGDFKLPKELLERVPR